MVLLLPLRNPLLELTAQEMYRLADDFWLYWAKWGIATVSLKRGHVYRWNMSDNAATQPLVPAYMSVNRTLCDHTI